VSKSFEQIFSESNPHGFSGYEGPCTCCQPKPTDKVTKAYNRGATEERERILNELIHADTRSLPDEAMAGWYFAVKLIKGEHK